MIENNSIGALLEVLPLYAEEGGIRQEIHESDLISLLQEKGVESIQAKSVITIIRRIFESLALLDPVALEESKWVFISFPASLFARSTLETLATPGATFFETSYWKQEDYRPEENKEEQRMLLKRMEHQRTSNPSLKAPNPIRTVHVTWGLIRIGVKYLLHKREDKDRRGLAGYVFPGGRLDPSEDLMIEDQTTDALRDLFRIDSNLAQKAQERTLARELKEELGLLVSEYQAIFHRILEPFLKVEGARNNHAYTQYDIAIYSIMLTREGELKVLDRAASQQEQWQWFSASDIRNGIRADGATPFVDALIQDKSLDTDKFLSVTIPDSSANPPRYKAPNHAIDLPQNFEGGLLTGLSGKQRKLDISSLTQKEWEALMLLAWISRGLEVRGLKDKIVILVGGWIKVLDGDLQATMRELSRKLQEAYFPVVECDNLDHCRLSIDAKNIYFQPDCFEYCWDYESDDKPIILVLKGIKTSWATLMDKHIEIPLSRTLRKSMPKIEDGRDPDGNIETLAREFRRLSMPARDIGLRQLITTKDLSFEIIVPKSSH